MPQDILRQICPSAGVMYSRVFFSFFCCHGFALLLFSYSRRMAMAMRRQATTTTMSVVYCLLAFHAPRIKATISSMPLPCLTWAKIVGPSSLILAASRCMTCRSAPTISARSVLLMMSRSDCVMPGPPVCCQLCSTRLFHRSTLDESRTYPFEESCRRH